MSAETPDAPSAWDEFKVVPLPNYGELDWDAIIGEPHTRAPPAGEPQ